MGFSRCPGRGVRREQPWELPLRWSFLVAYHAAADRMKEAGVARRRRGPALTGPDYLLGVASKAADGGQPFAGQFGMMVQTAFGPQGSLLIELLAQRPLKDYEASPVSIVLEAYEMAKRQGDREAVDEVVRVGVTLLAKWPEFLRQPQVDIPASPSRWATGQVAAGRGRRRRCRPPAATPAPPRALLIR